jgi:hypothetical protein
VSRPAFALAALGVLFFLLGMALPFLRGGDLYREWMYVATFALIVLAKLLLIAAYLVNAGRSDRHTTTGGKS